MTKVGMEENYTITETIREVELKSYIENYRDSEKIIQYCKGCKNYNKLWSCPPFSFDELEFLERYEWIYLILHSVHFSDKFIEESRGEQLSQSALMSVNREVRTLLDSHLLELERGVGGASILLPGSCILCPPDSCTRPIGEPCLYPDRVRPSLEALGFDIAKSVENLFNIKLLWGDKETLPQYLTFTSGLLAKTKVGQPFSIIN